MTKRIRNLILLLMALLLFLFPVEAAVRDDIFGGLSGGEASAPEEPAVSESVPEKQGDDWDTGFWDDWGTEEILPGEGDSLTSQAGEIDSRQAARDDIFRELEREAVPLPKGKIPKLKPIKTMPRSSRPIPLVEDAPWVLPKEPASQAGNGTGFLSRYLLAGGFLAAAVGIALYLILSREKEKEEQDTADENGASH